MARAYVSMGSNIEREHNVRCGIAALRERFGELVISSVYESKAYGFEGDNFYNLAVGFDTGNDVFSVAQALQEIEDRYGRARSGPRFSSRTLDLDLLLYDDLVLKERGLNLPRADILTRAFVLLPLAQIAPDERHPINRKTYQELWAGFTQTGQAPWPVEFKL